MMHNTRQSNVVFSANFVDGFDWDPRSYIFVFEGLSFSNTLAGLVTMTSMNSFSQGLQSSLSRHPSLSCFCGWLVLDFPTGRVSDQRFQVKLLLSSPIRNSELTSPFTSHHPTPSEFQSQKPPSPAEFQDAVGGMVWIFSGIIQLSLMIKSLVSHSFTWY